MTPMISAPTALNGYVDSDWAMNICHRRSFPALSSNLTLLLFTLRRCLINPSVMTPMISAPTALNGYIDSDWAMNIRHCHSFPALSSNSLVLLLLGNVVFNQQSLSVVLVVVVELTSPVTPTPYSRYDGPTSLRCSLSPRI